MNRTKEIMKLFPAVLEVEYDTLAERHAYAMGYIDGFYGIPKNTRDTEKHWPNAFSKGYWNGHADGQGEEMA